MEVDGSGGDGFGGKNGGFWSRDNLCHRNWRFSFQGCSPVLSPSLHQPEKKGAVRTRLAATYDGRWQLALLASIIFDRTDAIRFFIWQPAYRIRSMRAT